MQRGRGRRWQAGGGGGGMRGGGGGGGKARKNKAKSKAKQSTSRFKGAHLTLSPPLGITALCQCCGARWHIKGSGGKECGAGLDAGVFSTSCMRIKCTRVARRNRPCAAAHTRQPQSLSHKVTLKIGLTETETCARTNTQRITRFIWELERKGQSKCCTPKALAGDEKYGPRQEEGESCGGWS